MARESATTSRSASEVVGVIAAALATVAVFTVTAGTVGARPAFADAPDKATCLRASEEGQRLRGAGRLREARQSFLVCARDQCPAVVRDDCAQWTGEVTEAMPSVVFTARDQAARPLTDVKVEIDGESVATRLDGTPILVDPGEHHLRFAHEGSRPVERMLTLNKGEKKRTVVVDFDAKEPVAAPPPATSKVMTTAPAAAPATSGSRLVGPIVFGSAGIVALGIGTYLLVHASSDVSTLEKTCSPSCGHDAVQRIRTRALAGDIAFGVGATSLLAAGYMFFLAPHPSEAPQQASRDASAPHVHFDIAPSPGLQGGQALLRGTF